MMPQHGQPSNNNGHGLRNQHPDNTYFNLDPSQAAKQMAALSAASNARMANGRGGINSGSFLGGTGMQQAANHDPQQASQPPNSATFFDASMSTPNAAAGRPSLNTQVKTRAQGFLVGVANVMMKRNTPLPPHFTGLPTPSYDPSNSPFNVIDLSPEIGHFRLCGKDIDLFKLWGFVATAGGGAVCNWANYANQLGLPEELPQPHGTGATTSAHALQACYDLLLGPFEAMYKQNIAEQQRKAQMSSKQGGPQTPVSANRPMPPNIMGSTPMSGTFPQMSRSSGMPTGTTASAPSTPFQPNHTAGSGSVQSPPLTAPPTGGNKTSENVLDDLQGLKRKLEIEDPAKRVRQKLGSEHSEAASVSVEGPKRTRTQPARRKIEYVPLAREVETYGGRDLKAIAETEIAPTLGRDRPLKEMAEWGTIDTDALVLSLRSRIATEMSYALTTLAILSTMKGQTPGSGFPIHQCGDLFDELLDLVEDLAFDGREDQFHPIGTELYIPTHRQLTTAVYDGNDGPFVPPRRQGDADPTCGIRQRSGSLILIVITIVRNLSVVPENNEYISRQHRLVDTALRLCCVSIKDGQHAASSAALSLSDVITIRKDTLSIMGSIASHVIFSNPASPSVGTLKTATRLFQLISAYLVDSADAVSPSAFLQLTGSPLAHHAPPALADLALDVFTRLGQLDSNRQVFSKAIPDSSTLLLLTSLVRRLPLADTDFQAVSRESWISYMEKIVMAIYSIIFLAPPALKAKIKADRTLRFKNVYLRMVQKFVMHPNPEARSWYLICARRAIETLKVLDDGEDAFDTSKAVAPTMAFGMGWGDTTDGDSEQGSGLLASHRSMAWDMLMQREVFSDQVMFNELESLARVDCMAN